MNRSALVIRMLNYLYANGRVDPVHREVLAEVLETNVRNIVEFKKELEIAGYAIESITGKQGGYLLREDSIFPSITLSDEEKKSIDKVLEYLHRQSNFDGLHEFEQAMNKLKARISATGYKGDTIYLEENRKKLNEYEKGMLHQISEAKIKQYEIEIEYCKEQNEESEYRRVRPYEIIVNKDGFYVLAEDITPKKENAMKIFKITKERMKQVRVLGKRFSRDVDFKLSEYIGSYSLMKDEYEVEMKVKGVAARLVNEQDIENTLEKYWEKDSLYIRFKMEGKYRVKSFILSLGSQCEVISPLSMREEIKEELENILKQY